MASRRALRHRRAGHSLRGESAHANLSEIKPTRLLARTHRLTIPFRRNSQTLFITAIVEAPYEGIGEQGTFAASAAPASKARLSGHTDAPAAAAAPGARAWVAASADAATSELRLHQPDARRRMKCLTLSLKPITCFEKHGRPVDLDGLQHAALGSSSGKHTEQK